MTSNEEGFLAMDLASLLPDSLTYSDALILVLTSATASFITAAMGIGGGLLLLAIMASLVPISVLIPVHGLVQLGSNGNRALMTRRHIDKRLSRQFLLGAVLGALVASLIVVQLPLEWIKLAVASFILYLVWGPKPNPRYLAQTGQLIAGGLTTLISMFVGATGPLVAAFIHRHDMDKLSTTATLAACMSGQHLLKLIVFSAIGISFWQWLPLIGVMIVAGVAGTWWGLKLLNHIPAQHFKLIFRVVISVLAVRLVWSSF